MSIRVFEKLAKWTRISDDELAAEIIGMGEPAPTAADLTFARRLFARTVETVTLCAGAGDSLLAHPLVRGSDVYVSSDLRHHPASEFREQARLDNDTALIDISHWAAEWLWLDQAARELRELAPELVVTVSDINTDPWTFAVVQ
jgi:putative NIF3 family GTP cyclohydrolase 1 type 2